MKHLRETLLIDKNNTEAYNLLGECCIELGMDKQAEPLFTMAVKLDTSYISAICNLGKLYYDQKNTTTLSVSWKNLLTPMRQSTV